MALQKSIDTSYGVMAEYHKIVRIADDRVHRQAEVVVHAFKDAGSKTKQPLSVVCLVFSDSQPTADGPYCLDVVVENSPGVNHVSQAYTAIKQLPEYEGAVDV